MTIFILRSGSAPVRSIVFMLIGSFLLTMNDAVLKLLTVSYPTGQLICIRGIFVLLILVFVTWRSGHVAKLSITSYSGQVGRASCLVIGTFCWIIGLNYLPLADAVAIAYCGPLFITILASPLLGEKIGWQRWSTVLIGFCGVLLITRPGSGAMQWAVLLPFVASFTGALRDIITRRISSHETSESMLFFSTAALAIAGFCTLPFRWVLPTLIDLGLLAFSAVFLAGAHYLMIECFRLGEAAFVAPFKYSGIVWAIVLGFLLWQDIPDAWMISGAIIVISGGIYMLRLEARRR